MKAKGTDMVVKRPKSRIVPVGPASVNRSPHSFQGFAQRFENGRDLFMVSAESFL